MNEPQPLDTGNAVSNSPDNVSGGGAGDGSGDGSGGGSSSAPSNWAQDALLLMDDVDALIRWASVNAPMEKYTPAAASFWKVAHLLASERDRLAVGGLPMRSCGNSRDTESNN